MPAAKMRPDEVDTSEELVRRLIVAQFPQWSDLPVAAVTSAGTDNALYRLGDDLVVRLPRVQGASGHVDKEQRWLPYLAPHLPLAVPVPLATGVPGEGYPFPWSVGRWLVGENATIARLADPQQAARDLAAFIVALQRIDTTDGPPPGAQNFGRGLPLAHRDESTRAAIVACRGLLDTDDAEAAWEVALRAPVWQQPPVWIHGDLQSGNLLAVRGRLSAVIDFGGLCVGDPAGDLLPAWNLFDADTREVFRAGIGVDDATWARGRGWALSVSLIALPFYRITNPTLAEISRRAIAEVLADFRRGA